MAAMALYFINITPHKRSKYTSLIYSAAVGNWFNQSSGGCWIKLSNLSVCHMIQTRHVCVKQWKTLYVQKLVTTKVFILIHTYVCTSG